MAAVNSVWAIDIGSNSLKAIHLQQGVEGLEVLGFDRIEHPKILSSDDVTEDERRSLVGASLRKFVEKNDIGPKDDVAIGVPGQSSFARFITLPPVEPKRIPEIVKFEAVQQIPFDINEVEWDWQIMEKPDSPEAEVGIFAIKNELINDTLSFFQEENLKVTTVQMGPMALYNYVHFDRSELDEEGKKAVIVLNMGAENTELVICTKYKVWQRCIPLGGNTFTRAIADAFKLKFQKAEKLKRTAPVSKYARQIFQAMRPVFTDLSAEIQRSLGFFSSSARNVKFQKVIALGGAMKLQGIVKFLNQTLQIPVERPESFGKLVLGSEVSQAQFHENVSDFGMVYGLGVQALGEGKIEANLLPRRISRAMTLRRKSKIFSAAAGLILLVSILALGKANLERGKYQANSNFRSKRSQVIREAEQAQRALEEEKDKDAVFEEKIKEELKIFDKRDVVGRVKKTVLNCLPNEENNPEQAQLYRAFRQSDVEEVKSIPREEREQVFVTSMQVNYAESVRAASFTARTTKLRSRTKVETGGGFEGGDMGFGGYGMGPMGMPGGEYAPRMESRSRRGRDRDEDAFEEIKDGPGFVVIVEGYTPYKNVVELLDPSGVGDDPDQWGVVTRLLNLDKVFNDPNYPFELFERPDPTHFRLETGPVKAGSEKVPFGIGVEKVVQRAPVADDDGRDSDRRRAAAVGRDSRGRDTDVVTSEVVLVDPLTNEVISETFVLDDNYKKVYESFSNEPKTEVHDHWFRLEMKLLWKKDAEEGVEMDEEEDSGRSRRRGRM